MNGQDTILFIFCLVVAFAIGISSSASINFVTGIAFMMGVVTGAVGMAVIIKLSKDKNKQKRKNN